MHQHAHNTSTKGQHGPVSNNTLARPSHAHNCDQMKDNQWTHCNPALLTASRVRGMPSPGPNSTKWVLVVSARRPVPQSSTSSARRKSSSAFVVLLVTYGGTTAQTKQTCTMLTALPTLMRPPPPSPIRLPYAKQFAGRWETYKAHAPPLPRTHAHTRTHAPTHPRTHAHTRMQVEGRTSVRNLA